MAELPEGMMRLGRQVDDAFSPQESMYRRVPHDCWDDDRVNVDAIDLPDMSVNRSKYSLPQWVRLLSHEYQDWGVIGFQVKDIPPEIQHLGVHIFRFRPKHVPHNRNYPHSEVRAYYANSASSETEDHITSEFLNKEKTHNLDTLFPDELQLRWREQLKRKCRIVLQAYQDA